MDITKLEINGIVYTVDASSPKTYERIANAYKVLSDKETENKNLYKNINPLEQAEQFGDALNKEFQIYAEFLNTITGDKEAANKIFGKEVSVRTARNAIFKTQEFLIRQGFEFEKEAAEQADAIQKIEKEYKPDKE